MNRATVFLTHSPDALANYYGPRALAALPPGSVCAALPEQYVPPERLCGRLDLPGHFANPREPHQRLCGLSHGHSGGWLQKGGWGLGRASKRDILNAKRQARVVFSRFDGVLFVG